MEYLARHAELRLDPAQLLPGARCAIMVADLYVKRGEGFATQGGHVPPGSGMIARYARGRDYHDVMKRRLHQLCDALRQAHPGSEFRPFVDTAPVPERELAARAGLGWIAKSTMLINPRLGSYLLLGGALTTLDLVPAAPAGAVPDHCGTCTRCIDACPTGAITPWSVDATRCISYLTIERREPVGREFHSRTGDWIFGCDVCQEVCPHNSPRPEPEGDVPRDYRPRRHGFNLLEVLNWSEADRRKAFETSSMKRANLAQMKRNAAIAAGRAPTPELRAALQRLADDESQDAMVRQTARDVLEASHEA